MQAAVSYISLLFLISLCRKLPSIFLVLAPLALPASNLVTQWLAPDKKGITLFRYIALAFKKALLFSTLAHLSHPYFALLTQ